MKAKPKALCLITIAAVGALAGCRGSPLRQEATRSQYDRYDFLRNQWSEEYVEDDLGRRVPNLRARLLNKN